MGNKPVKGADLPTPIVVKRLSECLVPDEKEAILDYFEIIEIKITDPKSGKKSIIEFRENSGAVVVLKILNKMIDDDLVVRLGLQLFEMQVEYVPLMTDFIQFGGIDFLQKIIVQFARHDFIGVSAPKFLKVILAVGAKAAIYEIRKETASLQLCQACAEALERTRLMDTAFAEVKIPKAIDRINRVLMFMSNYPDRLDVLCAAMDAVLAFARNPDAKTVVPQTKMVLILGTALTTNPTAAEAVWRICLCYSLITPFSDEMSNQLVKLDIHTLMALNFNKFEESNVQQQILWMLSGYLQWPKTYRLIHESSECIDLFKSLMERRTELIKTCGFSNTNKFKPYLVVVPYAIRKFLFETKGEVAKRKGARFNENGVQKQETAVPIKKVSHRVLEDKVKFGTVSTEIYKKGEYGLLGEDAIETSTSAVETKKNDREWEKHLQYGNPRPRKS